MSGLQPRSDQSESTQKKATDGEAGAPNSQPPAEGPGAPAGPPPDPLGPRAVRTVLAVLGLVVGAVILVAVGSQFRLGVGASELTSAQTFSFSLLIGIGGAFVYLTMLLIADKDLSVLKRIWESDKLPKSVMVPVFLISGGMVAAMSEISTDTFARGDVWGIFLLGFGWLGAMSGVGGASVSKTTAEAIGKKDAELKA